MRRGPGSRPGSLSCLPVISPWQDLPAERAKVSSEEPQLQHHGAEAGWRGLEPGDNSFITGTGEGAE